MALGAGCTLPGSLTHWTSVKPLLALLPQLLGIIVCLLVLLQDKLLLLL